MNFCVYTSYHASLYLSQSVRQFYGSEFNNKSGLKFHFDVQNIKKCAFLLSSLLFLWLLSYRIRLRRYGNSLIPCVFSFICCAQHLFAKTGPVGQIHWRNTKQNMSNSNKNEILNQNYSDIETETETEKYEIPK